MVYRVYISSNCGFHCIDEHQNKVKGYCTTNHIMSRSTCSSLFILSQQVQFQEGEQCWIMSKSGTTTFARIDVFESRTTQNQEGENDEDMTNMHMTEAQVKIELQA